MSTEISPINIENKFKRIIDLALGGHTDSAIRVLNQYNLGVEQTLKVSAIITSSNIKDASPREIKEWIVSALNENPILELKIGSADQLSPLEIAAPEKLFVPDDKIVQIFSSCHIGKEMSDLANVCKHWRTSIVPLICVEQLNQKETLSVTELVIYQRRLGIDLADFESVINHCRNLIALDFSTGREELDSEDQILAILGSAKKFCPKLTGLNFKGCSIVKKNVLNSIISDFQNLTHLNLSNCGYCTHSVGDIQTVVASLRKLVFLDVSFTLIGNKDIIAIASNCPDLKELNIYNSCGYFATGATTDESIIFLAQKCKSLTRLTLSNCSITDASLYALAENCKGLTYFFHYGCIYLNEIGLSALKNQLPLLVTSNDLSDIYGRRDDVSAYADSSQDALDSYEAEDYDF